MVPNLSKLIAAGPLIGWCRLLTFQINRRGADSTVEPVDKTWPALMGESKSVYKSPSLYRTAGWLETVLIFLCFALYAGQLPPDVNESHYLTKAKHFWNPDWCPGDIFLSSSFAHWLFYVTTGWLTRFMSLSAVAWTGRIIAWALLAFAWRRFSWNLIPVRWVSIISAFFFLLLNDRFHLAGEWVVGGFEAKGIAYFFVLMALGSLIKHDWSRVWPFLGAASAFHVLVGGWAFLATLFTLTVLSLEKESRPGKPKPRKLTVNTLEIYLLPFSAGIALLLIGLIPPFLAEQSAPAEVAMAARRIYVSHRIAHHLSFDVFPTLHVARFTLIVVFWLLLNRWLESRWRPIHQKMKPVILFCVGSLLISFGGLILSGLAKENDRLGEISEGLLRLYWFRLGDFAIPFGCTFASCAVVCFWLGTDQRFSTRLSCAVFVICVAGASGLMVFERLQDPRPRADRQSLPTYELDANRTIGTYKNWRKVCDWISENTANDATFITPNEQQTFKWYTGRAEVVCWKDIPQDSHGILDWSQRLADLYEPQRHYQNGLMSYSDEQLINFSKKYGADYLLIPQRHVDLAATPTRLRQVYPSEANTRSTYVVFKF